MNRPRRPDDGDVDARLASAIEILLAAAGGDEDDSHDQDTGQDTHQHPDHASDQDADDGD
jgi:hypothetical protein